MPEPRKQTPVVSLPIKVVPGASRSVIAGWYGDRLKIRISAPPQRGKANGAVESLLAQILGLPGKAVRIVSGQTSAQKTVEIAGLSKSDIMLRIGTGQQA